MWLSKWKVSVSEELRFEKGGWGMKSIVIYYSLEGHTKFVAQLLAKELKAEVLELKLVKPFPTRGFSKFFWCGKSAVFNEKPELKTKIPSLKEYDLVVIGTPVWAGKCASPINSLLVSITKDQQIKGKKIAVLVTNGGGAISKCVKQIQKTLTGNEFLEPLHFVNPSKDKEEEIVKKIRDWVQAINN